VKANIRKEIYKTGLIEVAKDKKLHSFIFFSIGFGAFLNDSCQMDTPFMGGEA